MGAHLTKQHFLDIHIKKIQYEETFDFPMIPLKTIYYWLFQPSHKQDK